MKKIIIWLSVLALVLCGTAGAGAEEVDINTTDNVTAITDTNSTDDVTNVTDTDTGTVDNVTDVTNNDTGMTDNVTVITDTEAIAITEIATLGFTVDGFSSENTYYLCYPESFENIMFTKVATNLDATVNINVERYCDCDYKIDYTVGQKMTLGYGRAKVTVTVTSKTDLNNIKSYLFVLTDPNQAGYRYRSFTANVTVYTNATGSDVLATLKKGTTNSTMPLCIETSGDRTKIVIPSAYSRYHGQIGWVETKYLTREYYQLPEVPEDYADAIAALQAAHPNWTFEFMDMGVDMDDYAGTIANLYYTNTGKTVDTETVKTAMNPLNFLDEKNIFMFLNVSEYNAEDYTAEGVGELWVEKSNAGISEAQAVEYLLSAGNSLRVNTYFLTARAVLESGHGTSALAKGTVSGYEGYYNFYGIGAVDKDPLVGGGKYAKARGWDSPLRAITEGGNWINDQYIQRGQNTPYFFRFYPYKNHLYMSDLQAPQKDAANVYKCYTAAGKLDSNLHFIIPYYEYRYSDVSPDDWFYEDVYRATKHELFEGVGGDKFKPGNTLTRAQFVTVLGRISGADVSTLTNTQFEDVGSGSWYEQYVAWGYQNGVINGVSQTHFAPSNAISRQDLCTMLLRFANAQQIDMPEAGSELFADDGNIGAWAREAVYRCAVSGLVNGVGNNMFKPTGSATRAQGAKILSLFYEQYILKG